MGVIFLTGVAVCFSNSGGVDFVSNLNFICGCVQSFFSVSPAQSPPPSVLKRHSLNTTFIVPHVWLLTTP